MELDGLGRFADPAVLILSSLAGSSRHGYALIKDIEEFAGVTLGPGTLYGALARLEERRRPYRITAAGAAALGAYLRHAAAIATVGLRRLREST